MFPGIGINRAWLGCAFPLFAALTVSCVAARAESGLSEQLRAVDALFEERNESLQPGMVVGILMGDEVVYEKGFGMADIEHRIPVTRETVFHVASVSKQFTAYSLAALEFDGALDLDADIRDHLNFVPDSGYRITPRHLVHHVSGLRDHWGLFVMGGQEMTSRLRQSQVVNIVSRQEALNFPPGTDFSYSNTGYALMAELVHSITGKTLRQYAGARIFEPIGMSDTFIYDDVTEIVPNRAHSFVMDSDGEWRREPLNYDQAGATSLHTTAGDLLKWAGHLLHPAGGPAAELVSTVTTMGQLNDGTPLNYGFGLWERQFAGNKVIMHTGSDAGFSTAFCVFPEQDFAVVILANFPVNRHILIEKIADIFLSPKPEGTFESPGKARLTPAALKSYTGRYYHPRRNVLDLSYSPESGSLGLSVYTGEPHVDVTLRADGSFDLGDDARRLGEYYVPEFDEDGTVVAITDEGKTYTYGLPRLHRFVRLPEPSDADRELARFAGDYRSGELDITYTVSADIALGKLYLDHIWAPQPVELTPTARNHFDGKWPFETVEFVRDQEGLPTTMLISEERIRDVRFDRVAR